MHLPANCCESLLFGLFQLWSFASLFLNHLFLFSLVFSWSLWILSLDWQQFFSSWSVTCVNETAENSFSLLPPHGLLLPGLHGNTAQWAGWKYQCQTKMSLSQNDPWLECHRCFCPTTGPVRRMQKHTLRRPCYISGYCKSTGPLQTCLHLYKFPNLRVCFLLCVFPFLPCCWVTLVCVTCNSSLCQDLHGLLSKLTIEPWLKKKEFNEVHIISRALLSWHSLEQGPSPPTTYTDAWFHTRVVPLRSMGLQHVRKCLLDWGPSERWSLSPSTDSSKQCL